MLLKCRGADAARTEGPWVQSTSTSTHPRLLTAIHAANNSTPSTATLSRPTSRNDVKGKVAALVSPTGLKCNKSGLRMDGQFWVFCHQPWFDTANPPFIRLDLATGRTFSRADRPGAKWVERFTPTQPPAKVKIIKIAKKTLSQ